MRNYIDTLFGDTTGVPRFSCCTPPEFIGLEFYTLNKQGDLIRRFENTIKGFIKHIHPRKLPLEALAFNRTWGLGGSCLLLFIFLAASGLLMLFVYHPSPEFAYASIQSLEREFVFGSMVRGIHYFSANILIIAIFFHMIRVFLTGGYRDIRRINWIIGLCTLGCVLLSCFTGYLLPWDQTAYWAITICINMFDYAPAGSFLKTTLVGGSSISARTLQGELLGS